MKDRRPCFLGLVRFSLLFCVLLDWGTLAGSHASAREFTVKQLPLPTKVSQKFVIEDFENKVTPNDMGSNYFAGNNGAAESADITTVQVLDGSLKVGFNFAGQPAVGPFAGYFFAVGGLTDTYVSLDGSGKQPPATTPFPDYFVDTQNIFRDFLPWQNRSLDELWFDVRLDNTSASVNIKIELKDEAGRTVYARVQVANSAFQTIKLKLNTSDFGFNRGQTSAFDWHHVTLVTFIVERVHGADQIQNPDRGAFLLNNLLFFDADGSYPDLEAARANPQQYAQAFLEYIRATSFLYFLDFASTDSRTGGIIQDRSTFADLMAVGGVGFQLTAYVIGAERGYITRENAANRVRNILRVLRNGPQGSQRVGTIGYQGFFYHFVGIDGLRKQNYDVTATPLVDESKSTVELSPIDTGLALCGVLVARQYFDSATVVETEIRQLADAIYSRVNWPFMLSTRPGENQNQFFLGWKPNETRDDTSGRSGRFLLDDAVREGQYSSRPSGQVELPATLDYYTDEDFLLKVLAIGSPNPAYRITPNLFFSARRQGTPFVRTFPGSLFTYQFASVWLDTAALGSDRDPTGQARAINYFENTKQAITAARDYAIQNPNGRASLSASRWGLSACEGPFDEYFAESAPTTALVTDGRCTGSGGSLVNRPLEVGTLTVYGLASSILHLPTETINGLWEHERLGLLHPRYGFADAFNLNIANAAACTPASLLRTTGQWANFNGFAIDHGPMLIMIDNFLRDNFVPKVFMSYPSIRQALAQVFPARAFFAQVAAGGGYCTTFTLINTGVSEATGILELMDQNGNPLSIVMTGLRANPLSTSSGDLIDAEVSSFPVSVAPGASQVFIACRPGSSDTKSGWARVETFGGSLSGVGTFQFVENGVLKRLAGVFASQSVEFATIPVDNDDSQSRFTGFAVANISGEDSNIRIVTLSESGVVVDDIAPSELNPLGPQKQVARFLHEYLPTRSKFRGSMVLIALGGKKCAVVALVQNHDLMTAIPVIAEKAPNVPN